MIYRVHIDSRALEEALVATRWYSERNEVAAEQFVAELDEAMAGLAEHPLSYPARFDDFRQRLLRRFPFHVVFQIRGERVEVVAVAHASREPLYWKHRRE